MHFALGQQHHVQHPEGDGAYLFAQMSLASGVGTTDNQWLDALPPADTSTLLCSMHSGFRHVNTRPLVGELQPLVNQKNF